MGKFLKRFLFAILVLTMIICFGQNEIALKNVKAEDSKITEGSYGDDLKWKYKDGVLTIYGSGVPDYNFTKDIQSQYTQLFKETKEIKIEKGVTKIGNEAFRNFGEVTKVELPDGIEEIGYRSFEDCTSLEDINLPEGLKVIDIGAFESCSKFEKVQIPSSVTMINEEAFEMCSNLTKIQLPDGLTKIGAKAFYYCTKLKTMDIPSSVTEIGKETFAHCDSLKSIEWPKQITKINDEMFDNCAGLKMIKLPEGLETIGESVFNSCSNLEEIKIPDTVKEIGTKTFGNCTRLKSVKWPEKVEVINEKMFKACTSLEEFQFSDKLKCIGAKAFEGCEKLKYIEIPDNVEEVQEEAFHRCTDLEYIKLSKNMKELSSSVFFGCDSLTSVEIPSGIVTIANNALSGCDNLKLIKIPESVVEYKAYAIQNNSKDLIIVGKTGSKAEEFAKNENITFISDENWKCEHMYFNEIYKKATTENDGLKFERCHNCGDTVLRRLSRPIGIVTNDINIVYNGAVIYPDVKIQLANGKLLGKDYYENIEVKESKNVGSYTMKVVLENGYEGSFECKYNIIKADRQLWSSEKKEVVRSYDQPFSLKINTSGKDAKLIYKVSDPKVLKIDSKGVIQAKKVGKCTVSVYAEADSNHNRSNQLNIKIKIIPAKVHVKNIKAKSGSKIYLNWKRDTKVDGYYVNYDTNKKMVYPKRVQIKKNKTCSVTLKNLKKNKKYYVSVQAYKKVKSGKKYRYELGPVTKKTIKTK